MAYRPRLGAGCAHWPAEHFAAKLSGKQLANVCKWNIARLGPVGNPDLRGQCRLAYGSIAVWAVGAGVPNLGRASWS